jgi:hypothetical protein
MVGHEDAGTMEQEAIL